MSIKPDLQDIFERLNVPLPQPFLHPTISHDFAPIILIQNFQSKDANQCFKPHQTHKKHDISPKGIILQKAKEYFPSKNRTPNPSFSKSVEKHLKNCRLPEFKKSSHETKMEENIFNKKNSAVSHEEKERSQNDMEEELEVEMASEEKLIPESHKETYVKWNQEENMKYLAFIRENKHLFKDVYTRRINKTYKLMSQFIKTRNHEQCRSHHQKMIKKHINFEQIERVIISRNKLIGNPIQIFKTPKKKQELRRNDAFTINSQVSSTIKEIVDQVCLQVPNPPRLVKKQECQSPIMVLPSFDEMEIAMEKVKYDE